MINFNFIPNLDNALNLDKSSKNIYQNDKKMDFVEVLNKKKDITKNTNTDFDMTNFDIDKDSTLKKEDLEKIVDELNVLNGEDGEDYTLEDVVNLLNFWSTVDYVDKNNIDLNSFSLDILEGVSNEHIFSLNNVELDSSLSSDSIVLNEVFNMFELNDSDIKVPILKMEKINESTDLNVDLVEDVNTKINNLEIDMDMIKELGFENITVEDLEQIVDVFGDDLLPKLDLSKLDLSNENMVDILKSIDLPLRSVDTTSSKLTSNETLNILDINVLDGEQELTFNKVSTNSEYTDSNSSLNNFLFQQRVSYDELINVDIENNIETLLKMYENDKKNIDILSESNDVDILSEHVDVNNDFVEVLNQDFNSPVSTFVEGKTSVNSIGYTLRYEYLSSDIIKNLQYMKSNDIKELILKVNPRELGEISIQLTKSSDISKLVLVVEREEIFGTLKKDVTQISQQLKDLGMSVDDVHIQMKSSSENSHLEQSLDFASSSSDKNSDASGKDTNKKNNYNNKANEIESISGDNSLNDEVEGEISLFA